MHEVPNTLVIKRKSGKSVELLKEIISENFLTSSGDHLDFNKIYTQKERLENFKNMDNVGKNQIVKNSWLKIKGNNLELEGYVRSEKGRLYLFANGLQTDLNCSSLNEFLMTYDIVDISLGGISAGTYLDMRTSNTVNLEEFKNKSITIIDFDLIKDKLTDYILTQNVDFGFDINGFVKNYIKEQGLKIGDYLIDVDSFKKGEIPINSMYGFGFKISDHELLENSLMYDTELILNFNTNYDEPSDIIPYLSLKLDEKLQEKILNKSDSIIIEGDFQLGETLSTSGDYLVSNGKIITKSFNTKNIKDIGYFSQEFIDKNTRKTGRGTEIKFDRQSWAEIDKLQEEFNKGDIIRINEYKSVYKNNKENTFMSFGEAYMDYILRQNSTDSKNNVELCNKISKEYHLDDVATEKRSYNMNNLLHDFRLIEKDSEIKYKVTLNKYSPIGNNSIYFSSEDDILEYIKEKIEENELPDIGKEIINIEKVCILSGGKELFGSHKNVARKVLQKIPDEINTDYFNKNGITLSDKISKNVITFENEKLDKFLFANPNKEERLVFSKYKEKLENTIAGIQRGIAYDDKKLENIKKKTFKMK